jgi:hypothetical protein
VAAALAMPEVVRVLLDRVLEEVPDETVAMLVVAVEEQAERGVMGVPQGERVERVQVGGPAGVGAPVTKARVAPLLTEEGKDKVQLQERTARRILAAVVAVVTALHLDTAAAQAL